MGTRPLIPHAVVQPTGASLPELHFVGRHKVPVPERRLGRIVAQPFGHVVDEAIERRAIADHLALW